MQSEMNKQIVVQAWQAFATRDPLRIAAAFDEQAEWTAPPDNATAIALKGGHHMIGRARIAHFIAVEYHTLFRDTKIEFRHIFADGDTVIVEEHMQATLASGRRYENDYCFIFELKDGLIWRVREYMDTQRGHTMILGA